MYSSLISATLNNVSLQNDYFRAQIQLSQAQTNLSDANHKLTGLEDNYTDSEQEIQSLQNEITNAEKVKNQLEQQTTSLSANLAVLQTKTSQLQTQLDEVEYQKQNTQWQLGSINSQLQALHQNLQTSAPKPIYKLDGLYCINGIYMCTRHPPRRIVVNQNEIDNYKKMIKQREIDIAALESQRDDIHQHFRQLESQFQLLQIEYEEAKATMSQLQTQIQNNNDAIDEQGHLIADNQCKISALKIVQEDSLLDINQAQTDVVNYQQKVNDAQSDMDNLARQNVANNTNTAAFLSSYSDDFIEALAKQEIEQEDSQSNSSNFNNMLDQEDPLLRLARQELAEEMSRASSGISDIWHTIHADVNQVQEVDENIATTIGNLWATGGVATMTHIMMNKAEEIVDMPSEPTHDLIVDEANNWKPK